VRCTTDVDGEVTFDESGYWQTSARFALGSVEYEFLADERGRMPDLGPIPNPQVDGRWQRVGETREPAVWFAWGEAIPGNGTRPRRRSYEP
jgi:AcrR family transcriptional regulator